MEKPLTGEESHLVGAWVHGGNQAYDLTRGQNHGSLYDNPSAEKIDKLPAKTRPVRLLVGGAGKEAGNFTGKLSELRVWNTAQDEQTVKDGMHMPLRGREDKLAGNWRLGAIVIEQGVKQVPDFSTRSNPALVYGTPFVSERSLNRKNTADKKIVSYANDELVAVSQRARYRESFEFRIKGADGKSWTLDKLNNADGRNGKVFQFAYWGKASRSSEKTITFPTDLYRQDEFSAVAGAAGWFRASCEFTVPDGVAMVRTFGVSDLKGRWKSEATPPATEWTGMEVRKHQIEHISDAITRQAYTDGIDLTTKGGGASGTLYDLWEEIRGLELCEADLSRHLQNLVLRIDIVDNKQTYVTERDNKNAEKTRLESEINALTARESTLAAEISRLATDITNRTRAFDNEIADHMRNYHSNIGSRDSAQRGMNAYAKWAWGVAIDWHGWNRHRQWRDDAQARANSYKNRADEARRNKDRVIHELATQKITKEREQVGIGPRKQALQNQLDTIDKRLDLLNRYLANTEKKDDLDGWKATTQQGLERIHVQLDTQNTEFLRTLTRNRQKPQGMDALDTDSNRLVTQGTLLGFVSPQSRLQAMESARGNLELNYFDRLGNLQCTAYDATADSRNTTFEQWLPGSLRPAVEFRDSADKMVFAGGKSIDLGTSWTLETWFQYPLVARTSGEVHETQVLVENARGRQIVVKEGRYLGGQAGGAFFETSIDLDDAIAAGWHHLAVTVEKDQSLGFYLDGKKRGTTPKKYSLTFSGSNITDYVGWAGFKGFPTTAITVSLWIKAGGRNASPTPLSYGTAGDLDAFQLYDVDPLIVYVSGSSATTKVNLHDGLWHHLAVTWESANGGLKVYKDGRLIDDVPGFKQGYTIPGNGTLMLGQQQSVLGGGFHLVQAFDGSLRGLSIWNTVRSQSDIQRDMYSAYKGNEAGLVGYWPMETLKDGGKFKVKDLKATGPQPGEIAGSLVAEIVSVIDQAGYGPKTIGNSAGGGKPFGRLAELRLWRQSLSDEEIATHARANAFTGNEPGLVAYYPMTEASGTSVHDHAAGKKIHAVLAGADWKACTGEMNKSASDKPKFKALALDGTDDYVAIPGLSGQLGGDEITIEYWFKGDKNQSAVRQQSGGYIVAAWGATKPGHILSNDGGTQKLSAGDVQNNQWHHVAMTWKKGVTDGFVSYLDGEVVAKRNAGGTAIPAINNSLYLGFFNGSSEFTQGQLAEVRIWNQARSKEQLIADMHRRLTGGETGLKACYPLDAFTEDKGVIKVRDITPNNYHGTVNGAVLADAEDLFITGGVDKPQVMYFDGTDDRVDCGAIDLANKSFSFECWVKNGGSSGTHNFFVVQGTNTNNKGLCIGFRKNNRLTLAFWRDDLDSTSAYSDQDWHHFACTYDHTSRTQTLYRDGEQVGRRTANAHYSGTGNLYLGSGTAFKPDNTQFKGSLDEVRLWDRALSRQEIQSRRNQRLSGKEAKTIWVGEERPGTASTRCSTCLLNGNTSIIHSRKDYRP